MGLVRRRIDALFDLKRIDAPDRELCAQERSYHLRRNGCFSLAYGAGIEADLKTFGDTRGFIAYGQKMGYTFALGDPIAAPEHHAALIGEFIATFRNPAFVQAGAKTAGLVAKHDYAVIRMGVDTVLDLVTHSFAGRAGEGIRQATNWLTKHGFTIRECAPGELPNEMVAAISERWMRTRIVRKREVRFLNRPFSAEPTPDLRRFFLFDMAGTPVAFVSFDPLYRDGCIVGYVSSNKRREPDAPFHAEIGITRHAVDVFREEGLEIVMLGLSPFAAIEREALRDDPVLRLFLQRAFRSRLVNRHLYNLEGIAAFKRRFRGQEIPVYLGTPRRADILRLVALLRLCRVI